MVQVSDDDMLAEAPSVMPSTSPSMKLTPRFSFSVDSLLGRKTNECDVIKSEAECGLTRLPGFPDSDHKTDNSDDGHRGRMIFSE